MYTYNIDFSNPGVLPPISVKTDDSFSRFFALTLWDGGAAYTVPSGALWAVNYKSPAGSGLYDAIIQDGVSHAACVVSGSTVTCEIAPAVLTESGSGQICLQMYKADGTRINGWNIPLVIEANPDPDSTITNSDYYSVLTGQVAQALGYRDAAANSATAAAASAALAQQISQQSKGWYATDTALKAAFPTGQNGWWAIVGAGDNIWTWDADTTAWVNTHQQTDLSNYYTKAQSDANYAPASSVPLMQGLTATVEPISTASQAYAVGAYFVYNGLLYKCTVAIAQGGTITPGTNCTATTAGGEITALNQNLAGATGTFTAANSQITVDTGVDWHKLTLIQTTSSGAVGRLAVLTPDFGWANIAGTGYYEPTYAAAKSGNSAIIPAVVFSAWLSTIGTVRWLAE